MSLHHHKLLRQRSGFVPASGSIIESDPTPTASSLAQNTAAVDPSPSQIGVPLVPSMSSSPATSSQSTAVPTATSSPSSSSQISLGTTIGACVAAVVALLLALLLAFYCSKRQKRAAVYSKSRNVARDVSRRRSHLQPWKRINDDTDRWEGQDQKMTQRPPSGPIGAMFQRTISNVSGEKSCYSHTRESVGTMQHFAKYHSGLAAEMASQGTAKRVDGNIAKPPPVLHLAGRSSDLTAPISWDGETVGRDSSFSLHSPVSSSPSPYMATEKATPPAMTSPLHRWESAQVVHVGVSEEGELPNPFADSSSSIKSTPKGRNPFFSAQDHPVRRTILSDTQKNPFADPGTLRDPIRSLIAALEEPSSDSSDRIISMQSSVYSGVTTDDGASAVSVTAFPYPPTQVNVR